MNLADFIADSDVHLALEGATKEAVLSELTGCLDDGSGRAATIRKIVQRRESLGSTGVGHGIALPHCRTPLVDRLRVIYGRQPAGVNFDAVDGQPVFHFFLLVAPPVEVSNDYLPVLGTIARLARSPEIVERWGRATTPAEFLALLGGAKV
jgi:mannitol/fructose-specific phosphotransferase system IIA component (Ntr-type)